MSRAEDWASRLAAAQQTLRTIETERIQWKAPSGGASATVRIDGTLELTAGIVRPADVLVLARFLTDSYNGTVTPR